MHRSDFTPQPLPNVLSVLPPSPYLTLLAISPLSPISPLKKLPHTNLISAPHPLLIHLTSSKTFIRPPICQRTKAHTTCHLHIRVGNSLLVTLNPTRLFKPCISLSNFVSLQFQTSFQFPGNQIGICLKCLGLFVNGLLYLSQLQI